MKLSKESHYNFIHFTPIQTTGISGSCYSLKDHCQLSSEIFTNIKRSDFKKDEEWESDKQRYLKSVVQTLEKDCGMLSMIDIVLNHVSQNSPHLPLHKDMSYNLSNSPQLEAAIEVHKAIMNFSKDLGEGKVPNVSAKITNETDLNNILNVFKNEYLPKAAIWEYIVINVDNMLKEYKEQVKTSIYKYIFRIIFSITNLL